MSNYKLSENEKLLLQEIVGLNTKKLKTKLTLTNQKLVFEQEKGLFKKKLELIEIIDLKEIKTNKNKSQTIRKSNQLEIETDNKIITIYFENEQKSKRFQDKLSETMIGNNFKEKTKSVLNFISDNKKEITAIAIAAGKLGASALKTFKKK